MDPRQILSLAAFGILLHSVGCTSLPEGQKLTGNTWQLVSLQGKPVIPTRKPLTAEFLPDRTWSGYGGVNEICGSYKIHGEKITLGKTVSSTAVASPIPGVNEQEEAYVHALTVSCTYSLSEEAHLHLWGSDGTEQATFKKVPR